MSHFVTHWLLQEKNDRLIGPLGHNLIHRPSPITVVNAAAPAGSAVIHFVDTAFLDESQRSFWSVQRDMACAKDSPAAAAAATASKSSGSQTGLSPGIIAAIAVPCAVAALLAASMLYMQHAKLRRQRQQQQQPSLDSMAEDGVGAAMFRPDSGPHKARPCTSDSANSGHVDAAERGDLDQDPMQLLPAFEPQPMVPPEKLRAWLLAQQGKQQQWGGAAAAAAGVAAAGVAADAAAGNAAAAAGPGALYGGGGGSSTDSSGATMQFSEQLARDMDPVLGNPNIKE
jgi:hypothetical protein